MATTRSTLAQIDNPGTEPHTGHSTAPLEDGRILLGFSSPDVDGGSGDVFAQYLDTRQPGVEIVGDRLGANRDVLVGTVGDDGMTGGDREDQLYGGLGNDLLSGGIDSDLLVGGSGNDILIGAVGQDVLIGGDGDDVLWGGQSGPADPKVDRDLQDALTTVGFNAALIASEPGADIVMGGELDASGQLVDTGLHDEISFEGEFGSFNIDLSQGFVLSSRTGGAFVLEDVIGTVVVDDVAGTATFVFSHDVEDAHGGLGNDVLTGDGGNNILTGGGGNDTFDGRVASIPSSWAGCSDFTFAFDSTTSRSPTIRRNHPVGYQCRAVHCGRHPPQLT
jgi:Ca2+-binding RTX toxin-like protein